MDTLTHDTVEVTHDTADATVDTIRASELSPEDRAAVERLAADGGLLSEKLRAVLKPVLQLVAAGRDFRVLDHASTMTLAQVAERLQASPEQVTRLVESGRLLAVREGAEYRVIVEDVEKISERRASLAELFEDAYENEADLPPYPGK